MVLGVGLLLPIGGLTPVDRQTDRPATDPAPITSSAGVKLVPAFNSPVLPRTRTVRLDGQLVTPTSTSAGGRFYFLYTLGSAIAAVDLRKGFSLESGSGPLEFAPLGVEAAWRPTRSASSAAVLYRDLYPGVDIALSPTGSGVNVLVHRKDSRAKPVFSWRTPEGLLLPGQAQPGLVGDGEALQTSIAGSVMSISRTGDLKGQFRKVRADFAEGRRRGFPEAAAIISTIRGTGPGKGEPARVTFRPGRLVLDTNGSRWSGFSIDTPWSWRREWRNVPGLGPARDGPGGSDEVLLDDGSTIYAGSGEPDNDGLESRYIPRSGAVGVQVPQIAPAFRHAAMDPVCSSDQRITVLYGWNETNDLNRSLKEQIRKVIRDMNGWIWSEDRSAGGDGARLKVQCFGGKIAVWGFRAEGADSFSSIVSGAKAAGYDEPSSKYMIFWDSTTEKVLGGEGASAIDSSKWKFNLNNAGARAGSIAGYAAVYAQDNREGNWGIASNFGPYVPLHEMLHSMGAVNPDAPGMSRISRHCWVTLDLMCGGDAGLYHPFVQQCYTYTRLDCGKSKYFDPNPVEGEYLYSHWNIDQAENSFISHP